MRTNSIGSPYTNERFSARARALAVERFGPNYNSDQLSDCQDELMAASRGGAKDSFNYAKSPVIDLDALTQRGARASQQGPRAGAAAREMARVRPDLYAEARRQGGTERADRVFARKARELAMAMAAKDGRGSYDHRDLSAAQNEIAKKNRALVALASGNFFGADVNDPNPDLEQTADPGLIDYPAEKEEEDDGTVPCNNCNATGELPDGEECPECEGKGRVEQQRQTKDMPEQPTRKREKQSGQRANITTWSYEELNSAVRQGRATYQAVANETRRRMRMPARSKPFEKMSSAEKLLFFQPRVIAEMERKAR